MLALCGPGEWRVDGEAVPPWNTFGTIVRGIIPIITHLFPDSDSHARVFWSSFVHGFPLSNKRLRGLVITLRHLLYETLYETTWNKVV